MELIDRKNAIRQEVIQGLNCGLNLKQCEKGYFKLPIVPKDLYRGARGGLYYINQHGKRVYLNRPQKFRMSENRLPGIINPDPANIQYNAAIIPLSVFARANRQIEEVM